MEITKCPMCKVPAYAVRRTTGALDHYQHLTREERRETPNPIPLEVAQRLRVDRKGKKTVAITGAAWSSSEWTPLDEENVDVWCLNEQHMRTWMKEDRVAAWFQLHPKWVLHRYEVQKIHWGWLESEHPFPIYMQEAFDDFPASVEYPLEDAMGLLANIYHGEERVEHIFSSTFNYMFALALLQGYERIECFGIEMTSDGEYNWQREAMAFWLGKAEGMGVEVWLPDNCSLLRGPLYAYEETRLSRTGEILKE